VDESLRVLLEFRMVETDVPAVNVEGDEVIMDVVVSI
jgi:hypothetical protein